MNQHDQWLLAVLVSISVLTNSITVLASTTAGFVNVVIPNEHSDMNYENPTQYIFENYDVWDEEKNIETIGVQVYDYTKYTDWEIAFLKQVVMGEAGNQPEYGIRLVCDVVLNRVDDDRFPDTIYSVITQPNQFEDSNVKYELDYQQDKVSELVDRIVEEEIVNRTNNDLIYFTAGYYNPYCIPAFKVADHYFGY